MRKCSNYEIVGYIAVYTVPTAFYILRKQFSVSERRNRLSELCGFIDIAGVNKRHIIKAIANERFDDLEDCIQTECAESIGADFIITRNIGDFAHSIISAILPEDLLLKLEAAHE
jgi:hypothetical protein